MGRAGSGDQVRRILGRLREEVPGITLRSTILLGFPGETEADAAEAVEFVREADLSRLGAFIYSPEQGTSGFDLTGRVPAAAAQARYDALMGVRDEVLRASQRARLGIPTTVLVDEITNGEDGPRALARGDEDAPEVDMISIVSLPTSDAVAVGDRLSVVPRDLDVEGNLICELVVGDR
jgi:ribosomal protein S12 methylthiotransferase